ncbi:MAG: metallophosphoesterase [Candidatus Manganitrophaceae bacterium]|nr:MAG: metallophosphoesterase [Candidatus Manganitrophaceae bacterium]
MRFGVISDTHGRLDPKELKAFAGVDRIFHAGDVGSDLVLKALQQIAPVTAIRGNNDLEAPLKRLPDLQIVEIDGRAILLIHDVNDYLKPTEKVRRQLQGADPDIILSGHSHKGMIEQKEGVIYFNPGGAGPKRFSLKRSIGLMEWDEKAVRLKLILLEGGQETSRSFRLGRRSKPSSQNPSPRQ